MISFNDEKKNKFSLSKSQRLVKNYLFKDTFSQKKKFVGTFMVLRLRKSPDASLRLGLISSKKMHLHANKRNKSRRIIREVYRKIRPFLKCNYDILIVSRRSILNVKYIDVFTELLNLLLKADVITKENYDRLILSNGFTNE